MKPTYEDLLQENSELRQQVVRLERRIEELAKVNEELRRRGKRQAAPFSKGPPKDKPKRPGRKPAGLYGKRASRARPRKVDERVDVESPLFCDHCQGQVRLVSKESQYLIDLPAIRTWTTEFVMHCGECLECGKRVIGRHPRQTSQALGVAGVQIGPGVIALTAYLNKVGGLSYGKIATLLNEMAGLQIERSTLCRALQRTASKAQPIYADLVEAIRRSPVVYPDESGWREGGASAWLWAFTNRRETVYSIQRGRGYAEAASILGKDYAGVLVADGWAPYRRFTQATHQTCLAHLLRRCAELLETAQAGAARFPRRVKEILLSALAVRDRRRAGTISPHGAAIAKGRLKARMDRLLAGRFTDPENRRFAKHLRRHQNDLFVFLGREDVEATNWPAEQAIRPAVVNRKSCGGNRTHQGAIAQANLMTVMQSCRQNNLNSISALKAILCAPRAPSYQDLGALTR